MTSTKRAARFRDAFDTDMTNDPSDILKQIRQRGQSTANSDPSAEPQSGLDAIRARITAAQASRPKRTLTSNEQKRLTALQDIHAKLQQGQHVQNRRLKTWLTTDEYAEFEEMWAQQQELRKELHEKPEPIKEYVERLKLATLYNNRADYYSRRGKRQLAQEFRNKCDTELERILEYYAEIVHADSSLTVWFDRELDWSHGGDASADLAHVPRAITSNSIDAQGSGGLLHMKQSKHHIKLGVVERAIDNLRYE